MDLNQASQKQLMKVPGIGKVLSKRLIQSRPFASWSEVDKVAQIGAKRLESLREAFVLEADVEVKCIPKATAEAEYKAKPAQDGDVPAETPKATSTSSEAWGLEWNFLIDTLCMSIKIELN